MSVNSFERYCNPELPPCMRNLNLIMKSSTVPSRQIKNVFVLIVFSGVVCPTIAPSCTDQSRGSPSQPFRSLPLKIGLKPSVESAPSAKLTQAAPTSSDKNKRRIIFILVQSSDAQANAFFKNFNPLTALSS